MSTSKPGLVRAIGRWSLIALMVNITIGAGIFGLPSTAALLLGRQSPIAYIFAAVGMAVIAACVAEVASGFHQTGGPYLYAKTAFGRFFGLQTGWLLWLTRVTSAAAVANIFIDYLFVLWPDAKNPVYRLVILTVLIGGLAVINIRGVSGGTRLSNVLTVAKLLPLLIVVGWGFSYIYLHGSPVPPISESHSMSAWLNAVLLLIYAFTGFESALIPGGELKNASRDIPFALLASFPVVAIVYFLIQEVVVHLLPGASQTGHPLSAAAYVIGGSAMATIIGVGALLSSFGSLAANMIANPRLTLAFAEQGDFPRWFGSIHLRYRTPYISILVFTVVLWTLAVMGTFQWNAILSGISRLFAYGITCAALPVLRRRPVGKEAFRLPGGEAFAVLGILFALILLSRMGRSELIVLAITAGLSFLNWLAIRATSRLPQD